MFATKQKGCVMLNAFTSRRVYTKCEGRELSGNCQLLNDFIIIDKGGYTENCTVLAMGTVENALPEIAQWLIMIHQEVVQKYR